jgi:hypothetical protein
LAFKPRRLSGAAERKVETIAVVGRAIYPEMEFGSAVNIGFGRYCEIRCPQASKCKGKFPRAERRVSLRRHPYRHVGRRVRQRGLRRGGRECRRSAGTLSGYTIVESPAGKSLSHHEYEYKSKKDLAAWLFGNVLVFEKRDQLEERRNLYFFASDGGLSFVPASEIWSALSRPAYNGT